MNIDTSSAVAGGRLLGFFTVLLILTLNASNGRDLLDTIVPYIDAKTEQLQKGTKEKED